jgi:hypothetical protein
MVDISSASVLLAEPEETSPDPVFQYLQKSDYLFPISPGSAGSDARITSGYPSDSPCRIDCKTSALYAALSGGIVFFAAYESLLRW